MSSQPAGDGAFIDECMTHFAPVFRYVRTYVSTLEEAEDLMQEVMLTAFEARQTFSGGNLRAWLYQIARNRVAKHKRRKSIERVGQEVISERWSGLTTPQTDEHPQLQEALLAAFGVLSPLEQEVVRLKFARFENDEIARMLNVSRNHLNVLFYRAIQKLRARIDKNDKDPRKVSVQR